MLVARLLQGLLQRPGVRRFPLSSTNNLYMSSPSSTLDSVWARQKDRIAAGRGQYVSRYTPNLGAHDSDLHTPSGESKLNSSNAIATLSLAELTGMRMDSSSLERRTPRQSSPLPYTPTRSWNAAIFNKAASSAPVQRSLGATARTTQPSIESPPPAPGPAPAVPAAPTVASVADNNLMKPLNPYASAWAPPSSSSASALSSDNHTKSWEQHSPPQQEVTSITNNEYLEENILDTQASTSQQPWDAQIEQISQPQRPEGQQHLNTPDDQPPRDHQNWSANQYQEFQEQKFDVKKQPEQTADRGPRGTSSDGQKAPALREISHRLQRDNDEPEESLNQRIERIRISNEAYMKKREIIEAEEASRSQNKAEETAAENNGFIDPDEEIRREREANAARKLKAAQLREWDAGKKW